MEPPAPAPPKLDYGNQPPLAWVGRNQKKLITLSILLSIVGPLLWYHPPLWHWVQWQYWMRQAMAHRMQDDLPLIVNDPMEIARFSGHPDYIPRASGSTMPKPLYYAPRALRELIRLDPRFSSFMNGPVTFLGTMYRPDGQPRLVSIRTPVTSLSLVGRDIVARADISTLAVIVAIPPTFNAPPQAPATGIRAPGGLTTQELRQLAVAQAHPTDVFRARINPADASHLIITNVRSGETIHLFLQDDDTLRRQTEWIQAP